ncbi:DUF2690 domain-containing protein [Streptomyces sp. NPDC048637]|uniref:DUF2690 domain-containing protein n=1 Tax=Streptomyces sp. NPDC048637 TaxID=3155636 RepID=UPI0034383982
MRFLRTLATVAGAMALATVAAPAPAVAADAASGCRGSACTGKNPQAAGCGAGARTIDRVRPAGGGPEVVLRNSARCSAAWAQIQKANSSWRFKIEIRRGGSYVGNASPNYRAYTAMAGSSNAYRACVEEYDGRGGSWSCTKWH